MEKNEKNTITRIPDKAVKVKEDGQWAVFWSEQEKSFYFISLACPSYALRLFRDELLKFAQNIEIQAYAEKYADAVPVAEEGMISTGARDKRQFKRFTRRCEAEFTCQGVLKRSIASDFSIKGLFIRTNNPFAPNEVIDILVHLPDDSVSSLQGRVMRSMKNPLGNIVGTIAKEYKNGMGIEITKKDAAYLHFIRSLVK